MLKQDKNTCLQCRGIERRKKWKVCYAAEFLRRGGIKFFSTSTAFSTHPFDFVLGDPGRQRST